MLETRLIVEECWDDYPHSAILEPIYLYLSNDFWGESLSDSDGIEDEEEEQEEGHDVSSNGGEESIQ